MYSVPNKCALSESMQGIREAGWDSPLAVILCRAHSLALEYGVSCERKLSDCYGRSLTVPKTGQSRVICIPYLEWM
eukprot:IDg14368t1